MIHLSLRTVFYLILPTILWAGNAVVGRLAVGEVSPLLLNTVRWALAAVILLPLGWKVFRSSSSLWQHRLRFLLLGFLGMGSYNALLYLALQTSTPINLTLIGASMPIWMLIVGGMFYAQTPQKRQLLGAVISLLGVVLVLSRGDLSILLGLELFLGDLLMVLATIFWAFYSWMISRTGNSDERDWPWAEFLLAQVVTGLFWSTLFSAGELATGTLHIELSPLTILILLYIAIGPSLIAYRCWGLGVSAVGPAIASFFANLIPLFTALMSAALLGEPPQLFHALAFILIVAGIFVSSKLSFKAAS
jgi:drug/metabolite transporter (DMT)-like permease